MQLASFLYREKMGIKVREGASKAYTKRASVKKRETYTEIKKDIYRERQRETEREREKATKRMSFNAI